MLGVIIESWRLSWSRIKIYDDIKMGDDYLLNTFIRSSLNGYSVNLFNHESVNYNIYLLLNSYSYLKACL